MFLPLFYCVGVRRTRSWCSRGSGVSALCATFLLMVCACGMNAYGITITSESDRVSIEQDVEYLVEGERSSNVFELMQHSDTLWSPLQGEINFGYVPSVHWFRIPFENTDAEPLERLLEVAYPLLDNLSIYLFTGETLTYSFATGDALPFARRAIEHRNFIFPLTFAPEQSHTLFIRAQTAGALQLPLTLWNERDFYVSDTRETAVNFMYYGILLIMAAFNLTLFFLIRDKSFVSYVFFVTSILVTMASVDGYIYQFFLQDAPRLHEMLILMVVPLTIVSICVFTMQFLQLEKYGGFWHRGFIALVVVGVLAMIGAMVLPYAISTRISVTLILPVALFAMAAGLRFWRVGSQSARLFTVAWFAILVGVTAGVLNRLGFVEHTFFIDYGIQLGTTAQTLLFSLALAARFNSERDARMHAQQEYVEEIRKRRDVEMQLMHAASHHEITGLPNRVLLERSVREYVENGDDARDQLLLVLLHVCRFDDVNKTLGHRNADVLLRRIGERVNHIVSNEQTCLPLEKKHGEVTHVAHVEGVSFCFCMTGDDKDHMLMRVESLVDSMTTPIEFMGLSLELSFLVGSSFDDEVRDPQALLRQAFIAFDQSSHRVSNVAVYTAQMNPYSPKRLTLMTELRSAIEYDGLTLNFQPQINLLTNSVCGFEALLRWSHHEFGFVPPDEFIPMAEKTGLMKSLTHWVLCRAAEFCQQLEELSCDACVSVNISALNLREANFCRRVCDILDEYNVPRHRIVLEVTETAAMLDPESALHVLKALNEAGVRLSIDDFGTGHSSLSYIRQLPVQEIKIDRSFVGEMDAQAGDATIVKTTINMCHDLGFEVVAEGVENATIVDMLTGMGCDVIQGYHIARPMSRDDTMAWLRNSQWHVALQA